MLTLFLQLNNVEKLYYTVNAIRYSLNIQPYLALNKIEQRGWWGLYAKEPNLNIPTTPFLHE